MNMKKYKVVVSDNVIVPVKGALHDEEGKEVPFEFKLTCKRLGAADLQSKLQSPAVDFMKAQAIGWSGQRLVLEEDGTPAEFNPDSMAALLDIAGMAYVCYSAFSKHQAALEKN